MRMRVSGVITGSWPSSWPPALLSGRAADRPSTGAWGRSSPRRTRTNRISAWVYFAEKPGLARLAAPGAIVSERSLERRRRVLPLSMVVDQTDLPVEEDFVAAVVRTGVLLRERSKWLNAVSVSATPDQLRALAALPFVRTHRADTSKGAGAVPSATDQTTSAGSGRRAAKSIASRLSYGGFPGTGHLGQRGPRARRREQRRRDTDRRVRQRVPPPRPRELQHR